jgi:hypothetical protein
VPEPSNQLWEKEKSQDCLLQSEKGFLTGKPGLLACLTPGFGVSTVCCALKPSDCSARTHVQHGLPVCLQHGIPLLPKKQISAKFSNTRSN